MVELLSHKISIATSAELDGKVMKLTLEEAEELYNLLHKELKKDSGVIFNSPSYRDLRIPEPTYTITTQPNTESFKPEFYVGDDINPPNLTTCRVNGGVSI